MVWGGGKHPPRGCKKITALPTPCLGNQLRYIALKQIRNIDIVQLDDGKSSNYLADEYCRIASR